MLDKKKIFNLDKKIVVSNVPFPNAIIKDFLPIEIVKKAENEFLNLNKTFDVGLMQFQKTKKALGDYFSMPHTVKEIINFFYSQDFINILETKFQLKDYCKFQIKKEILLQLL